MLKVNTAATGHGSRSEAYGGGLVVDYNVFPDVTGADKSRLQKAQKACEMILALDKRIDIHDPCNKYFNGLPKGNSFHHYCMQNDLFVDYSPSVAVGFYGATHSNDKDIAVTAWCLTNSNHWLVAATILHELAHVAGAPGGASHAAEKANDRCGFKLQYDPAIMVSIQQLGSYLERLA